MPIATVSESDDAPKCSPEQGEGGEGGEGVSALQFRIAVVQHHRIVYRAACALLGDRHEAEDVTHEAFLRYWQHGSSVRSVREWLLKAAPQYDGWRIPLSPNRHLRSLA